MLRCSRELRSSSQRRKPLDGNLCKNCYKVNSVQPFVILSNSVSSIESIFFGVYHAFQKCISMNSFCGEKIHGETSLKKFKSYEGCFGMHKMCKWKLST